MGIRGMVGRPRAERSEAMTSGKRVYPMMQTLCAKELSRIELAKYSQISP